MPKQNSPINGSLTFYGDVAGQVAIQGQSYAGNFEILLPNTLPARGQLLTAITVNGLAVTLGWATPTLPPVVVTTVFDRTGTVTAQPGDYSAFYDAAGAAAIAQSNAETFATSQGYITSAALSPYAPLASPTFTGTVVLPSAVNAAGTLTIAARGATIAIINTGSIHLTPAAGTEIQLGNVAFESALHDGTDATGGAGQILSSTGPGTGTPTTLWIDPPTPGGPNNAIQFNNNGVFDGSASPGGLAFYPVDGQFSFQQVNDNAEFEASVQNTAGDHETLLMDPGSSSLRSQGSAGGQGVWSVSGSSGSAILSGSSLASMQGHSTELIQLNASGTNITSGSTIILNAPRGGAVLTNVPLTSDNSSAVATTSFVKAQGYLTAAPVTSVFSRSGAVVAATNDYSFSQISGVATAAQLPPPVLNIFLPGTGSNNQVCLYLKLNRAVTFPAGVGSPPLVSGSLAVASVAATGSTAYTFKKNGVAFATVVFASGTTGVFTQASTTAFNGTTDIFEIDGPATADATLANIGFSLVGS
jgi:hypothetical protein